MEDKEKTKNQKTRKIICAGPSGRFPRTAGPGESHSGPRDFSKPFIFFAKSYRRRSRNSN